MYFKILHIFNILWCEWVLYIYIYIYVCIYICVCVCVFMYRKSIGREKNQTDDYCPTNIIRGRNWTSSILYLMQIEYTDLIQCMICTLLQSALTWFLHMHKNTEWLFFWHCFPCNFKLCPSNIPYLCRS